MAQYGFYQDERCTVWLRTYYTIEAPTWEEALVKAASIVQGDKLLDDDIRIEGSEFLDDTIEALPNEPRPEEATMEFFARTDTGDKLIADDLQGWFGVYERNQRSF